MLESLPAGVTALDSRELDTVVGGSIWRVIVGAATVGYATGRWIYCALECVFGDA